jgi:site-specific DNA-cytosine methylase
VEQLDIFDLENKKRLRVLVACEESQAVCIAFRELGHDAYSCDIQDCSGGHPEWHIKEDVLKHLHDSWDLIIAHPPCTDLAVSGGRWFKDKVKDGRQEQSIDFFMEFTKIKVPYVIENPVSIMSSVWRKPDQIINPWQFGDPVNKKTCLWLHNVSLLRPTKIVPKQLRRDDIWRSQFNGKFYSWGSIEGKKMRSKTFPGIAKAMAEQWGGRVI